MKILYVTTISNTVNLFLIPHIKFLIEEGHKVDVAFDVDKIHPELLNLGCEIYQVNFHRNPISKGNIAAINRIRDIISSGGYEIVHVHTPIASFLTRFACKKMKDIKVIYTAHGFHFFKGAPRKNWLIYYLLERIAAIWTDALITINEEDFHNAQKLKVRIHDSIYKIHGIGLNLNKFLPQEEETKISKRKEYGFLPEDFILINVGELCIGKQQNVLIEAVSILVDDIPNIKLLIVGDGRLRNTYMKLVQRLGLVRNVEFLGYREDVNHLMTLSDVAVSVSKREGLPVNVMEAMATGLPLVVTDCRGNRDLIKDRVNGLVIDVEDSIGCAKAIKELYESKELRLMLASKNLEMIKPYSQENVIKELNHIYSRIFKNCKVNA